MDKRSENIIKPDLRLEENKKQPPVINYNNVSNSSNLIKITGFEQFILQIMMNDVLFSPRLQFLFDSNKHNMFILQNELSNELTK